MNSVVGWRAPGPGTLTVAMPRFSWAGSHFLTVKVNVPPGPVTGLTGEVMSRTWGCDGGGPSSVRFTVTGVSGAKSSPSTTNGEVCEPWLMRTMHRVGDVTSVTGVPFPHTVVGGGG